MKHRRKSFLNGFLLVLSLAPAAALAHPGHGAHSHFDTSVALVAGLLTAATIYGIAAAVNRKMRSRAPTAAARRSRI